MGVNSIAIKAALQVGEKIALRAVDGLTKHGTDAVVKQIDKKKKQTLHIPSAAESYYHRNCEEVKAELSAYGFTNIVTVERKDLVMGLLTKDGAVEEISINGKANFKQNAKFSSDARVVIIYHTFKGTKEKDVVNGETT